MSFLGLSLLICANAGVKKGEYFIANFLPQLLPEVAVGEKSSGEWPGFSGNQTGCRAAVSGFPSGNCGLRGLRLSVLGGEIMALSLGGAPRQGTIALRLCLHNCVVPRGAVHPQQP